MLYVPSATKLPLAPSRRAWKVNVLLVAAWVGGAKRALKSVLLRTSREIHAKSTLLLDSTLMNTLLPKRKSTKYPYKRGTLCSCFKSKAYQGVLSPSWH
jgi:hypothetical protein